MPRVTRLLLPAVLSLFTCVSGPADDRNPTVGGTPTKNAVKKDAADDLLDDIARGTPVRLVAIRDRKLDLSTRLYWRTFHGTVAAETVPAEFRLDDDVIMASQLSAEVIANAGPESKLKPTSGFIKIDSASKTLFPGKIVMGSESSKSASRHPAIKFHDGKNATELQILCSSVSFEAVDQHGAPVPQTFDLFSDDKSLIRQPATISKFTFWLPVGLYPLSHSGYQRRALLEAVVGLKHVTIDSINLPMCTGPESCKVALIELCNRLRSSQEAVVLV